MSSVLICIGRKGYIWDIVYPAEEETPADEQYYDEEATDSAEIEAGPTIGSNGNRDIPIKHSVDGTELPAINQLQPATVEIELHHIESDNQGVIEAPNETPSRRMELEDRTIVEVSCGTLSRHWCELE